MELPCKLTVPLSGEKIPAIALNKVDLPLPFFPIIPKILPCSISKDTPFKALNISTLFLIFFQDARIDVFFNPLYFMCKLLTVTALFFFCSHYITFA